MMKKGTSIKTRIILSIWTILVPMSVLLAVSLGYFYRFYQRYDGIVRNITQANEYNMTFKENLDSVMYYIIVGSIDYNDQKIRDSLGERDPYTQIDMARQQFEQLRRGTDDKEMFSTLSRILSLLGTLEQRVDDIVENVREGGHYDENIQMFNMDISNITQLVQDTIQEYIYEGAIRMEQVRKEVSAHVVVFIRIMLVLFAVMLVISFILSRYMTGHVIKPIQKMCEATKSYAAGDFSKKLEVRGQNELDTLANSFNKMGDDIEKLIQTVGEEQKEKQSLEMKLLTAEINPHFLYNTLDTIVWLTEAGDNEEAVDMLTYLSDFFRVSLSNGRDVITVGEEETHINSYLAIQKMRFSDVMDYRISIDDEIKGFQMVKMTLQPLVENAIYHGVRNQRHKGMISVTGKADGGSMVFTISDTGRGMSPEELKNFRQRLDTGEPVQNAEGHGFGVANVVSRLRLYYGNAAEITVSSEEGKGTELILNIPQSVRQTSQQ